MSLRTENGWSGLEGRLSPAYHKPDTGFGGSNGRQSPAYHRSDTYPPPSSPPTYTNIQGRRVQSMKVKVHEERSLEEFDFFRTDNLFDNSDSDEDSNTQATDEKQDGDEFISGRHNKQKLTAVENTDLSNNDELDSCMLAIQPKKKPKVIIYTTVKKASLYSEESYIITSGDPKMFDSVVTYQYRSCSCLADDCKCTENDDKENVDTLDEDEESEIYFNLTDYYAENSGMELCSTKNGHFINVVDPVCKYPSIMNLKTGDKILGINAQAISCFHHEIVLIMFRYILFSDENKERVTLVVERRNENDSKKIFEIILDVKVVTRGNPAVNIHPSTSHSGHYRLLITGVKWKSCYECRIQNAWRSNTCVVVDSKGDIKATPILYTDGGNNVFKCDIFNGLCHTGSSRKPDSVFIGVFRTWVDDAYIVASTKSKLTLMKSKALDKNIKKIEYADPRFFFVYKTHNGNSYFESMLYRGWYWRVDEHERLEMIECKNSLDILARDNMQFTIIHMKSDV